MFADKWKLEVDPILCLFFIMAVTTKTTKTAITIMTDAGAAVTKTTETAILANIQGKTQ